MAILTTGRQIGQTFKSAARLRTIVGVFASHGFQNIIERAQLGRFLLKRILSETDWERYSVAERLRMGFEQLGPTFVKLGQLLATRPDLIPEDFILEFKKLHDQVAPVPFEEIKPILQNQYGEDYNQIFRYVEETPLASASIAQVHRATLADGSQVVLKIQRPGIVHIINDDLNVLYTIAALLEKYVPESKLFSPQTIVDEFFKTLELETNFVVEANNIRRFSANFANHPEVKIPHVHIDLTGPQVLVMEALQGTPLSQVEKLKLTDAEGEIITKTGLRTFFKMVFKDRFFHGDIHAGNLFILPNQQIGLIDFGVVGRLSEKVRDVIADIFVALAQENYERLADAFLEISPYNSEINIDKFARDLRDLIAPYYGLTFKNVNAGKILMDSTRIAVKHHLVVPSELMLFFKAVVTIEGLGRVIIDDFDVLNYSLDMAQEIVKSKYDKERVLKELLYLAKDSTSLLSSLPRQVKQLLRRFSSGQSSWKLELDQIEDVKRAIETSSNIIFLGLIIGSLILSASIAMFLEHSTTLAGLPIISTLSYILATLLGFVAFYNYIKK